MMLGSIISMNRRLPLVPEDPLKEFIEFRLKPKTSVITSTNFVVSWHNMSQGALSCDRPLSTMCTDA